MPPKGNRRAGILPACPTPDGGSRETDVGFEPGTFWPPSRPTVSINVLAGFVKQSLIALLHISNSPRISLGILFDITLSTRHSALHHSIPALKRCVCAYEFTPRTLQSMIIRIEGSRFPWSNCSSLVFLACLKIVERLLSQCGLRNDSSTLAQPPSQVGIFRSNLLPSTHRSSPYLPNEKFIDPAHRRTDKQPLDLQSTFGRQLQTIEQGSKTLICISFTKLNIHLLLERVFLNFSGYSLTVTQLQANATKRLHQFRNRSHFSKDAKQIYEKTYYSHASSVVSTVTRVPVSYLSARFQRHTGSSHRHGSRVSVNLMFYLNPSCPKIAKYKFGFDVRLTWNPAKSLAFEVFKSTSYCVYSTTFFINPTQRLNHELNDMGTKLLMLS
ncbi:hypothetical protein CSKR_114494 [Clonorchis sinensis]|uniref:Uncharacterized protein n=1 Tax=Clonorchis sinensis TaxID=79923 RepID=A0A3R7C132_CLOSI|nr:hypothetical protein CSKR_114494 [Clonorchis sinensis]